jgi:hypothetical protein
MSLPSRLPSAVGLIILKTVRFSLLICSIQTLQNLRPRLLLLVSPVSHIQILVFINLLLIVVGLVRIAIMDVMLQIPLLIRAEIIFY